MAGKKKKVLMLAVCRPEAIGGQAACARMLLSHFDDVEWTTVSFPLPGQYNSFMRFFASVGILIRCIWICVAKRIEVVHLLTACGRSALFEKLIIARVLKLTGVKVILNFQGALDYYYASFSPREKRFVKNALAVLDVIICLHDGMKNFLIQDMRVNPEKIYVIPNATLIEPEIIKVKNGDGLIRLVYFGWIVASKGLDVLIKACAVLSNQYGEKKFSLDITGPEVEHGLINKLKALSREEGVEQLVKYHPPVFGDGKKHVFASSDIFVFPTRMEGFPFVLLEAMQAGLPVVSTNIIPVNLVIQHDINGLLFEKDNASDLASKIHILMNDERKMSMIGKAARQHIAAHYSVEKIMDLYRALYGRI